MTVVARRVIATPARSSSEAWRVIVSLLAPDENSQARRELDDVLGIASSLIADEAMRAAPIVVSGSGPRVRVYCLYDSDAIDAERASEGALSFVPTAGDWQLSLPCSADDLAWVQEALKKKSSHITARDMTTAVETEELESEGAQSGAVVDKEAFLRS